MVTKRELLGLVAGSALAGGPAGASAAAVEVRYGGLVVFGDSLSDSGNAGRYSDGPVWVERMAERLGLRLRPARAGGTNYAIGGARARGGPGDLRSQADAFLAAGRRRADASALHVVWAGANDLLTAYLEPDRERAAGGAAAGVAEVVGDLVAAGATRLLVPNLPDIGMAPVVRSQGPAVAAAGRRLAQAYNTALAAALDRAERERPGISLHRLDVFALGDKVAADPGAFGFRDVANPCPAGGGLSSCEGHLFWDGLHPTAFAHARLAEAALRAIGVQAEG